MENFIFRPQDISKKFKLKNRIKYKNYTNYNFRRRTKWYPVGWRPNKINIANQFSKLHYLALHAPEPIQKKYFSTYKVFYKKHFGNYTASARYLNIYSCHSWL